MEPLYRKYLIRRGVKSLFLIGEKMKEQYKKIIELLEFTHGKYHSTYIFKDFVVLYAIAIKIYMTIIKKMKICIYRL